MNRFESETKQTIIFTAINMDTKSREGRIVLGAGKKLKVEIAQGFNSLEKMQLNEGGNLEFVILGATVCIIIVSFD